MHPRPNYSPAVAPHHAHTYSITVPAKIWRPKPKDRYVQLDYGNEIDADLFLFPTFGQAIKHKPDYEYTLDRDDIHLWDQDRDNAEFTADLHIGASASPAIRTRLDSLVQQYWDCFYKPALPNLSSASSLPSTLAVHLWSVVAAPATVFTKNQSS